MDPIRDGDFELVTLRGGDRAVREVHSGEVMHPSVGPWGEANALYVEQSHLAERLAEEGPPLCLFDVGLGAATNLAAALTCARDLGERRRRALHVVSFERDLAPLRLALGDPEGFAFLVPFRALLETLARDGAAHAPGLSLRLLLGEARACYPRAGTLADIVFFDPFSPKTNLDLWTPAAFAELRAACRLDGEGATLFTYSAATPTRVSLLLAGFSVGVGAPIGGKRETTAAATRRAALQQPLDEAWIERWRRSSARAPHGGWPEGRGAIAISGSLRGEPAPSPEQVPDPLLDQALREALARR